MLQRMPATRRVPRTLLGRHAHWPATLSVGTGTVSRGWAGKNIGQSWLTNRFLRHPAIEADFHRYLMHHQLYAASPTPTFTSRHRPAWRHPS